MNEITKRVALVVRDLLSYDEQLIRVGRQNFTQKDFETDYIVVDDVGQSLQTASLETFDGDAESLSLGGIWRGPVTLDFYGSGTYNRAIQFSLLLRSQGARELKRTHGITIYHPTGPTDLKQLTGQQYGERLQIEMQVEISLDSSVDTLRIDTAQLEFRNEQGTE